MKQVFAAFLSIIIAVSFIFPTLAEDGVTDEYIQFGQTADIRGATAAMGIGMRDGIQAAFDEVNKTGGVYGRLLKLITLDDGYEPDRAVKNVTKLINEEKVFSIIGAVGTPTSWVSAPVACKKDVPFIGPFAGASFLREMDCVVNVRGTYCQEAEKWIKHLTEDLGSERIALFYQDCTGCQSSKLCVNEALDRRGMKLAGEGTYKRNTMAVKGAVMKIKRSNPDAIVTIGAYKPISEFIKIARKVGMDVPVLNLSFTGGKVFSEALGEYTDKVIVSQVMPSPSDLSMLIVKEYHAALKASNPSSNPDYVSMEGYLVGRLAVEALKKAGKNLNREFFLKSFNGSFDLGGVKVTYDMPQDNQGMDDIFLTTVKADGTFEAINSLKFLKEVK